MTCRAWVIPRVRDSQESRRLISEFEVLRMPRTPLTRSPSLISEPAIPGLQELPLIVAYDPFNHAKFLTAESEIARQTDW